MKKLSLYTMSAVYVAAGINHFVHPHTYSKIMPPWLPVPGLLIVLSGIAEIVFGLLLLPAITRRFAAGSIIALLVAVFPANVQMLINFIHDNSRFIWIAILRLPLQIVLIWWAHQLTLGSRFKS